MNFSLFTPHHLRGLSHSAHVRRSLTAASLFLHEKRASQCRPARSASSKAAKIENASRKVYFPENNSKTSNPQFASRIPLVRAFGFTELGIDDGLVTRLEKAYPDVQRPTLTQTEYIPAVLEGKDVVVHDETGSGK